MSQAKLYPSSRPPFWCNLRSLKDHTQKLSEDAWGEIAAEVLQGQNDDLILSTLAVTNAARKFGYSGHDDLDRPYGPDAELSDKPFKIVCVSDTHALLVEHTRDKITQDIEEIRKRGAIDILIHAGDLTGPTWKYNKDKTKEENEENRKSFSTSAHEYIKETLEWIRSILATHKIVIAGNHDHLLDPDFRAEDLKEPDLSRRELQPADLKWIEDQGDIKERWRQDYGITYLNHETFDLVISADRTLRVFGSPKTPRWGKHAFQYPHTDTGDKNPWNDIPDDVDILITHGPPQGHMDTNNGCELLTDAFYKKKYLKMKTKNPEDVKVPRLHIFGHVHEGHGRSWTAYDEALELWQNIVQAGKLNFIDNVPMKVEAFGGDNLKSVKEYTAQIEQVKQVMREKTSPLRTEMLNVANSPGFFLEKAGYQPPTITFI